MDYYARKFFERLSDERIDRLFDLIADHGIAESLLRADDLSMNRAPRADRSELPPAQPCPLLLPLVEIGAERLVFGGRDGRLHPQPAPTHEPRAVAIDATKVQVIP